MKYALFAAVALHTLALTVGAEAAATAALTASAVVALYS